MAQVASSTTASAARSRVPWNSLMTSSTEGLSRRSWQICRTSIATGERRSWRVREFRPMMSIRSNSVVQGLAKATDGIEARTTRSDADKSAVSGPSTCAASRHIATRTFAGAAAASGACSQVLSVQATICRSLLRSSSTREADAKRPPSKIALAGVRSRALELGRGVLGSVIRIARYGGNVHVPDTPASPAW